MGYIERYPALNRTIVGWKLVLRGPQWVFAKVPLNRTIVGWKPGNRSAIAAARCL